jgi:hypothetical protein
MWFRIGEEAIFFKRAMNIQFSKEFRRVFHDEQEIWDIERNLMFVVKC